MVKPKMQTITHSEPSLEKMLEQLAQRASAKGTVTVEELLQSLGRRSFAPILLVTACVGFTPLGAVPSMPSILALIIILVTGQIILGRKHLWLPKFILAKRLSRSRVEKMLQILKGPARVVDRFAHPRLPFLTQKPFSIFLAAACLVLALAVPPLEFVPFVDIPLWAAIVALSFALAIHDGIIAIIAFAVTIASLWIVFDTVLQ
jgi:hypothetical protein